MTIDYYYVKSGVNNREFNVHQMIYNMNIVSVPEIYGYEKSAQILTMRRIPNMCVADMYGENFEDLPTSVAEEIRNIITILYAKGIEYPDITGYNFIEYQNKVWIIDFGHASFNNNRTTYDPFIKEFIEGRQSWNPAFR